MEPDEQGMEDRGMEGMNDMSSQEEPTMISVSAFQSGGRVERTGIALVHEGEFIYPAPGSEALISTDSEGMQGGQVINYYFPVEVEVIGTLSDADMKSVAHFVCNEVIDALNNQKHLVVS